MGKIRKRYSFRIIWALLTVLFIDTNIVYSSPPSALLRIPIGQKNTISRVKTVEIASKFLETPNRDKCELCGSENNKRLFSFNNCIIVRCSSCDLIWMKHPMSFENAKTFYEEEYYAGKTDGIESSPYASGSSFRTYEANKRIDEIEKICQITSLLDIGCGMGHFLKVASDRGIKCQGIDISTRAVEYAKSIGLNVKQGDFLEVDYNENHFQFHIEGED